jgi:hypothetical protein
LAVIIAANPTESCTAHQHFQPTGLAIFIEFSSFLFDLGKSSIPFNVPEGKKVPRKPIKGVTVRWADPAF